MQEEQIYESSEEDIRESGAGILEFSTAKAGQDITPANYDFEMRDDKKKSSAGLSNLAGSVAVNVLVCLCACVRACVRARARVCVCMNCLI